MNLRVDLILETEQRSASMFNAKSLVRLVVVLVPSLILIAFLISFAGLLSLKNTAKQMDTELEIKQPKVARADALSVEVAKNERMEKELAGWRTSSVDWHRQFVDLMKITPKGMYFESLRVSHSFQTEKKLPPSRKYSVTIAGKSKGANSEDNVLLLKRSLTVSEFFSKCMNPPDASLKQDPTQGAKKTDRIFRMECNYKPRMME